MIKRKDLKKLCCRKLTRQESGKNTGRQQHKQQITCAEAFTLAEETTVLQLTGLQESAERKVFRVKEQFKHAREKATGAFNNDNEDLEIELSFDFAISISLR